MIWLQMLAGAQVEKPGPKTQSEDSSSLAEQSKPTCARTSNLCLRIVFPHMAKLDSGARKQTPPTDGKSCKIPAAGIQGGMENQGH